MFIEMKQMSKEMCTHSLSIMELGLKEKMFYPEKRDGIMKEGFSGISAGKESAS